MERVFQDHRPAIESLYEAMSIAEYGRVYKWDELSVLANMADVRRPGHVIQQVNRRLVENAERLMVSIRGVGYKICNPEDMADHASKYRGKARNSLRKSYSITRAVPLDSLSSVDKQKLISEQSRSGALLVCFEAVDDITKLPKTKQVSVPTHSSIIRLLKGEQ